MKGDDINHFGEISDTSTTVIFSDEKISNSKIDSLLNRAKDKLKTIRTKDYYSSDISEYSTGKYGGEGGGGTKRYALTMSNAIPSNSADVSSVTVGSYKYPHFDITENTNTTDGSGITCTPGKLFQIVNGDTEQYSDESSDDSESERHYYHSNSHSTFNSPRNVYIYNYYPSDEKYH